MKTEFYETVFITKNTTKLPKLQKNSMKLFCITTNTPKLQNSMKLLFNNKHTQTTKFYETVFITTNTPKLQNSMKLFL